MKITPCWQISLLASLAAALILPSNLQGQSDNFDSGVLNPAWLKSEFSPALTTYTFPANGSGNALRLTANPAPPSAPAVAAIYRTNVYTDFYMAVDLTEWGGESKNQAIVLIARYNGLSANNPASGFGIICNYDCNQHGENAGDRRQGQLQINTVAPNFVTSTKAVAEFTLVVGRPHRLIFKGVGTTYTVQAYDLADLTKPLVTLEIDDPTHASGVSGILGFSRQGVTGTVDTTLDNYFAGPSDPNSAIAPAIAHPLAGTPQVMTRTPTNRFFNLYPAANGITFNVQTLTANMIDTAATKLFLNNVDVSSSLAPLPANGTSANFATASGTLAPNAIYNARIEVQDVAGTLKSTNMFWFDTLTDAYLQSGGPVKTIEAEDYNYNNGQFQTDPIPVSGFTTAPAQVGGSGVGYLDLTGTPGVDYFDLGTSIGSGLPPDFRLNDFVGTQQGQGELQTTAGGLVVFNDNQRAQYKAADVPEYQVRRFDPTEWMNYTRVFANTNYNVYLRVGSFAPTTASLDQVTSDPTVSNQTTAPLGVFNIPNGVMRSNYRFVPLMVDGTNAVVSLSGTNTVRLTSTGTAARDIRKMNPNYILFVPAQAPVAPSIVLVSSGTVNGTYTTAAGASVNTSTKTITVPLSGEAQYYGIQSGTAVTITGISRSGGNIVITYN